MLDSMPHYYAEDPMSVAVVASAAAELDRVEDMLEGIRAGAFPQTADDSYRMLGLWENLVGLPVEPTATPVQMRRDKLMGYRRRAVKRTRDWVEAVTTVLGTTNWTWERTPGKRVLITVPFGSASYTAGTAIKLIRRITPTHIEVAVTYGAGFILGESLLGEATL
jgi:hypothetical protein